MFRTGRRHFYYASIIKRFGHIFRQADSVLCKCVNSPLFEQLQRQRSLGGRHWIGQRSVRTSELLRGCGLEVPFESSGRRDSRTSSGSLVRFWGSLWFSSMRDSEWLGGFLEKRSCRRARRYCTHWIFFQQM